ncbi:hypothetical protein [Candidatus Halobonum tyrrellensis]|uniref:Uncharacterized protein n=1 Tax=Candidatus Halobonum tyrrellensis G22 TaxID=1324957 RepID=V4HD23_9EURY|nr:hypothetical protein [Candidatus Halobonum tyrrellensis]ESP87963.1 hypothetical protein K933_11621 [Candidatus Halobonum tyrrellensis G22]
MPISDDEWDEGSRADSGAAETTPVGEYETEKDLIVAFLSENVDSAYTRPEIVRGVDFGDDARPETIRETLTEIQDELVDLTGDLAASGMVVDDVDEALDELVAEETVTEKEIRTGDDGSTTTYYRLNTGEADE